MNDDATLPHDPVAVDDRSPALQTMRREVLAGLREQPKRLPSHYLYDEIGARLFEQICEQPEYYPTRTEAAIMQRQMPAIVDAIGPGAILIEPGSGSGEKAEFVLSHMRQPAGFVPIDIAAEQLQEVANRINARFPDVHVQPICADFSALGDVCLEDFGTTHRCVFFPGSTIGNFLPNDAVALLRRMARLAGAEGRILIGVDLRKDRAVLEPAYNDDAGVSAAFALNYLTRLTNELHAELDPDAFFYAAPYNEAQGRIEMSLVSRRAQTIRINGERIHLAADEPIITEYSYKHTPETFADLAAKADLRVAAFWTDPRSWFSVQYLQPQ